MTNAMVFTRFCATKLYRGNKSHKCKGKLESKFGGSLGELVHCASMYDDSSKVKRPEHN